MQDDGEMDWDQARGRGSRAAVLLHHGATVCRQDITRLALALPHHEDATSRVGEH